MAGWESEEAHDNVNHLLLHTACFDAHPPHAHSSTLMLGRRVYFKLHSAPHNIFLPAATISLPLGTKVQPTVWKPPHPAFVETKIKPQTCANFMFIVQ